MLFRSVFDDRPAIVENATIRDLGNLRAVLSPPADVGSSANSRPLVNLSLALNYAAGGLDPTGYHAVNIALHALAALALFGVVRRTCLRPRLAECLGPVALPLALATALAWAVHPLQTETVACVIQRTEGLVGLLYLFAAYALVRAADEGAAPATRRAWAVAVVAACLLGVFMKELIGTAPVVLFLFDRTFLAGSFRTAWRARRGLWLALAATWLPLAWVVLAGGRRALLLGPLAVDNRWQDHGLGSTLMNEALKRAQDAGERSVILVGDAPYYQRFGFEQAPTSGLWLPGPVDPKRFLAREQIGRAHV